MRDLMRNVLAETVLGLAILAIVGVLGTLPSAGAHMVMHLGLHLHSGCVTTFSRNAWRRPLRSRLGAVTSMHVAAIRPSCPDTKT